MARPVRRRPSGRRRTGTRRPEPSRAICRRSRIVFDTVHQQEGLGRLASGARAGRVGLSILSKFVDASKLIPVARGGLLAGRAVAGADWNARTVGRISIGGCSGEYFSRYSRDRTICGQCFPKSCNESCRRSAARAPRPDRNGPAPKKCPSRNLGRGHRRHICCSNRSSRSGLRAASESTRESSYPTASADSCAADPHGPIAAGRRSTAGRMFRPVPIAPACIAEVACRRRARPEFFAPKRGATRTDRSPSAARPC